MTALSAPSRDGAYVRHALARLQTPLDRIYARRHPGPLLRLMIRAMSPLTARMKPNDKWSLGVHAPSWMKVVREPAMLPLPASKRIFIFSLYRGQFSLDLPLAALLAWRGHRVTVGYLNKLGSPSKPPLVDHASARGYLADALGRIGPASDGRVTAINLADYADEAASVDWDHVRRQSEADARMAMARETIDGDDPEYRRLRAHYEKAGEHAQRCIIGFLAARRGDFDLGIIPNGATYESSHVCQVLRQFKLPFNTMEKFAFRRVRVLNHGDDFRTFVDLDELWKNRESLGFVGAYRDFAAARAMQLMDERRRSSTTTWAWSLQKTPAQDVGTALADAGVKSGQPFALVCTNVPWDAGYDKLCRFFPSMRAWLVETVRTLLSTDLHVVVRCHPGEASYYGGNERSDENLAAAGLLKSDKITVIPGEKRTNTYGLMEQCKFGSVFSSTTGLEMAMMGRRVIVGADVYYRERGFTVDIADANDHASKLLSMAREPRSLDIAPNQATDARLFHFLLHYALQWPYAYDKGGDAQVLTPVELVRSGKVASILQTLDALATTPNEFHSRIASYLSVQNCRHLPMPGDEPTRWSGQ